MEKRYGLPAAVVQCNTITSFKHSHEQHFVAGSRQLRGGETAVCSYTFMYCIYQWLTKHMKEEVVVFINSVSLRSYCHSISYKSGYLSLCLSLFVCIVPLLNVLFFLFINVNKLIPVTIDKVSR